MPSLANTRIYACSKISHAGMWQHLRAQGLPINSSWVDVQTANTAMSPAQFSQLWLNIRADVHASTHILVYLRMEDFVPEILRGGLTEVGAILLHAGKPAIIVTDLSMRQLVKTLGTWLYLPEVTIHANNNIHVAMLDALAQHFNFTPA